MKERIILGENCVYSRDSRETSLNNNLIVIGGSGSGKTTSLVEPQLIEAQETSFIVPVTKRRIVKKYTPMLRARGYDVQELNIINASEGSVGFEPLEYIERDQDIVHLAESIVKADPQKKCSHADPFWDQMAVSLVCAIIGYVLLMVDKPSFVNVLDMLNTIKYVENNGLIATNYDEHFEKMAKKHPTCFANSCWRSFHELPIKTAACVFGTLNTVIDCLFDNEIKDIVRCPQRVNFYELANKRTVLFVSTSPVNSSHHFFSNLFYGEAFKQLFEFAESRPDNRLPRPVHIIADDFATGGTIPQFAQYISVFREADISVTLLLQSLSQLESLYGYADALTIQNNCDMLVYMGGNDRKTAEDISVRLNAPIDEVLSMPLGQEVVIRRGQRPIVTRRYDIMNNKEYQRITREYEKRIATMMR